MTEIQEQDTAKMVSDAYNAYFKTGTNDDTKPRKIGRYCISAGGNDIGEVFC